MASQPDDRPPDDLLPTALAVAGVVVVCLCSALAAVLEALLVPLYAGSTSVLVPIAVPLAIASNVVLPRMALRLVPLVIAAAAPFVVWLVVTFVFGVLARPEGDVILPGGSAPVHWVTYGLMLGGALAGTVTLVLAALSVGTDPGSPRPAPPGRR